MSKPTMTKTERKLLANVAKNVGPGSFYTIVNRMLAKAKSDAEISEILSLNDMLVKTCRYDEQEHRHLTYRKPQET